MTDFYAADNTVAWSIPGGARNSGESAEQAATREAAEEIGVDPARLSIADTYTATCAGGWTYATVVARLEPPAGRGNTRLHPVAETAAVEWVHARDVGRYLLHPGFRGAWEQRLERLVRDRPAEQPHRQVAPPPPVDNGVTGWRFWRQVSTTGDLVEFVTADVRTTSWWPPDGVRAHCVPHMPGFLVPGSGGTVDAHPAPADGCDCGVRVLTDLAELLAYVRWGETYVPGSTTADYRRRMLQGRRGHPIGLGASPETGFRRTARDLGPDYYRDREQWQVLDTPDVVGRVVGSGRTRPSPTDTPSTRLVEYATVGARVYLSPQLWESARPLARRYRTEVVVGSTLGLPWLEEIEQHEGDHPVAGRSGSVTWLAPPGSVLPT